MEFVFEDKSSQGFSQPQDFAAQPSSHSMQMSSNNNLFGAVSGSPVGQSPARRSRRSLPESVDEIELTGRRKRPAKKAATSKVKYIKAPAKKRKTNTAKFVWTWQKFWWMVAVVTFMRLLFMENGVVDYYNLENTIVENQNKLVLVQKENADLVTEIHKIQTSPKYQRKVARDHLGVISSNEYLVLFSGE